MIDELREVATVCMESYQQRTTNLYNKRVRQRAYQVEDVVLRMVFEKMIGPTTCKFQQNWEGSYMIVRVGPPRFYVLDKLDEAPLFRMWNATHLKRYYQ